MCSHVRNLQELRGCSCQNAAKKYKPLCSTHKAIHLANGLNKLGSKFSWRKAELSERPTSTLPQQDSLLAPRPITATKSFLLGTGSTDPPPLGTKDRNQSTPGLCSSLMLTEFPSPEHLHRTPVKSLPAPAPSRSLTHLLTNPSTPPLPQLVTVPKPRLRLGN